MKPELGAQIGTSFLLLFGTFICGILPVFLIRKFIRKHGPNAIKSDSSAISFLTYLGGGVLFSTCFLQLMPEARETLTNKSSNCSSSKSDDENEDEFPMTEVLISAGFFGVYLIEKCLHKILGHDDFVSGESNLRESVGHAHSPSVIACTARRETDTTKLNSEAVNMRQTSETPRNSFINSSSSTGTTTIPEEPDAGESKIENMNDNMNIETSMGSPLMEESLTLVRAYGRKGTMLSQEFSFKGLILVIALSFHSVFEGLAIGLQPSVTGIWKTFAAVCLHKFVISFVVGLEIFIEGLKSSLVFVYMILFSVMAPVGIMISTAFSNEIGKTRGVINALAVGTLFYVTFMEILQREPKPTISGIFQLLAITLGFAVMAAIVILVPDN